jgi:Cu(I)/Ag(I) efflux system membrane fusion protein
MMKRLLLFLTAAALGGGWFWMRHFHKNQAPGGAARISFYQSPMHPWVKSSQPGQCTVCGMNLVPVYEGGAGFDHASRDIVMLPPGSPAVIGVATSPAAVQPLQRTLRVAGMIGEDESRHGVIAAPVEGRIDGLAMNHEGQAVTGRQPLATIFSRTLLAAAQDYQNALQKDPAAAVLAKRKLEQYGLVEEQINAIPQRQPDNVYFGLLAHKTGVIVKSYVAEGQYVKEGDRLFEIADFKRMWFMFPAYEQDLPFLQKGQVVRVSVPGRPGPELKARIAGISPGSGEMSRSAMVRVVLENPDGQLLNKSYAEGTVELDAPEVLCIPRSAALWSSGQPRVYVEQAPGAYEARQVKAGRTGDTLLEVLSGVEAGERVVTRSHFLMDSQAQLDAMAAAPEPVPDHGQSGATER